MPLQTRPRSVPQVMVRTIPEIRRKSLYIASHAGRVLGTPEEKGRALIDALLAHATQRQFGYTHRWRVHDLVMMGGFKRIESANRFCRVHDEVRNLLRPCSRRNEMVSLTQRRLLYTARTRVPLTSSSAAETETPRKLR